jgi:hypothetical protein
VDVCLPGGSLQFGAVAALAGDRMSLPGIRPSPQQRLCGTGKIAENRPQIQEVAAATRDLRICGDFFSSLLMAPVSG